MASLGVRKILRQIKLLNEFDRRELETELAANLEKEWEKVARKARSEAASRRVDQSVIDTAVEQVRYGPPRARG